MVNNSLGGGYSSILNVGDLLLVVVGCSSWNMVLLSLNPLTAALFMRACSLSLSFHFNPSLTRLQCYFFTILLLLFLLLWTTVFFTLFFNSSYLLFSFSHSLFSFRSLNCGGDFQNGSTSQWRLESGASVWLATRDRPCLLCFSFRYSYTRLMLLLLQSW